MSLMINKKDIDIKTGGLTPLGWLKVIIMATILLIVVGVIILLIRDFNNTSSDFLEQYNSSDYVKFDSKSRFMGEYQAKLDSKVDQSGTNSSGGGSSYDPNNLTWGGMPIDFYLVEMSGEWGSGHGSQKWADDVPKEYQVPWAANVGGTYSTGFSVEKGDGGMGPPQVTYNMCLWLKTLISIDPVFWEPVSQWANDPSIEKSNGKVIGYIEPLNKTLMELSRKDYHKYMDESFQAYLSMAENQRSTIDTVRFRCSQNGVDFDTLPIYVQSVLWAISIRWGPYNVHKSFSSTDPDTIVKQACAYMIANSGEGRWKEMEAVAFAMKNGELDFYSGSGFDKFKHHGNLGISWFYENWAKGGAPSNSGSSTNSGGSSSTGSSQQGSYLSWKQGGGQPWSNDATLGASGNTIAKNGCAVVSTAIMLNDMGVTTDDPGQVNKKFASVMSSGNMMQFDKVELAYATEIPNGLVYSRVDERCDLNTADGLSKAVKRIDDAKKAGKYVILQLDYKKDNAGDHFVYCTGTENGKVKVADPGYAIDTLPDGYASKDRCVIVSFRIFEKR